MRRRLITSSVTTCHEGSRECTPAIARPDTPSRSERESNMATLPASAKRSARVLELMKEGDDAFNARDLEAINAAHHPDMIAHVTGNDQPIVGRKAHAAAMQ